MPDDPLEFWRMLRANDPQEAKVFEQFLVETGRADPLVIAREKRQEEFKSGRLGRRMERENLNEAEMLQAEREIDRDTGIRGAGVRGLGAMTSLIRDIPGAEMAAAGMRSVVRGQPYAEALGDIREAGQAVNPVVRGGLRFTGGGMAAGAIPGSPAMQGAAYGALQGGLTADPGQTGVERGAKAAIGGAVGGAIGKAMDVGGTLLRARRNPGYEKLTERLVQRRSAAVDPLYQQAEREGMQNLSSPLTPELRTLLDEPYVKDIVRELRKNPDLRNLPVNHPKILKEISQGLTDLQSGATAQNSNMAGVVQNTAKALKGQYASAVSGARGPMPTMARANQEYAAQSELGDALARGADAMSLSSRSGNALSSLEALAERGPESLMRYLKTASPEAREFAARGAEAAIQRPIATGGVVGMANPLRTVQRVSAFDGGDLLRRIDQFREPTAGRTLMEFLQSGGIAAGSPSLTREQAREELERRAVSRRGRP